MLEDTEKPKPIDEMTVPEIGAHVSELWDKAFHETDEEKRKHIMSELCFVNGFMLGMLMKGEKPPC